MTLEVYKAITTEDKEAVYRFRYAVYVEEMGRYQGTADHADRRLVEPEDDHGWIYVARDGADVVGTGRVTWGGDGFSERQVRQYGLQPFLDELPAEIMAVGERLMIDPTHRGTNVLGELVGQSFGDLAGHDVHAIFGAGEPHLLPVYIGMGQRPYADANINSEESGYLIPLVTFLPGPEALAGRGRNAGGDDAKLPDCVVRALKHAGTVLNASIAGDLEYWNEVHRILSALEDQGISAFDGFHDEEAQRCLARSNVIECRAGDRVVKRGGTARNMFVVLHGTLEVRDGDRVVGVLAPGDVFGETAFLLESTRGMDVYAATPDVRVLSLSEGNLRRMIAEDPVIAAKLLLNVSRMLCRRLVNANSAAGV